MLDEYGQDEQAQRADFKEAISRLNKGDLAGAEKLYQKIVRANPYHYGALMHLGVLAYRVQKYDMAVDYYLKALAINRKVPDGYFNLGSALQAQEKYRDAVDSFRRAVSSKPDDKEAHYLLGRCLEKLGKNEEAATAYRTAIALDSSHTKAVQALEALEK
ncbi:tetratricopeptide repeat protein [Desulfurispira natronophila]|uniref:Flp pilus assembly protein TadD n=1 Tax=Desulfurispira natronophila TaxID=682562 RepID=A0A7W8DGI9_9BACT|nr:tetratricopeptide repeat protein [Desulfurispira natronophila]MBB5021419.1 Flp pilus assembly protein TadD [Desulfurispira natronophila]